jgi:hypothetical protein
VAGADNHVLATCNRAAGQVAVEVAVGGEASHVATAGVALRAPLTFAFVPRRGHVIAPTDSGSRFVSLLRARIKAPVDLRVPVTLSR